MVARVEMTHWRNKEIAGISCNFRALTKPANAKIARTRRKNGGNFCFLRQLHL